MCIAAFDPEFQFGGSFANERTLLQHIIERTRPHEESERLAARLLERCGGLGNLMAADPNRMRRVAGWGPDIQRELHAALQIAVALTQVEAQSQDALRDMRSVIRFCRSLLARRTREHLLVLLLDKGFRPVCHRRIQTGTVDHVTVYPREILKAAIEEGASAIILAHNHPSGDPVPSAGDIDMTCRLAETANALGIAIADHLIIAAAGNFSFRENGLLDCGRSTRNLPLSGFAFSRVTARPAARSQSADV
jgi:DNA repair protein RadC